jgi:hypothetical protein
MLYGKLSTNNFASRNYSLFKRINIPPIWGNTL